MKWSRYYHGKQMEPLRREIRFAQCAVGAHPPTRSHTPKSSLAQQQAWRKEMLETDDETTQIMLYLQLRRCNGNGKK